MNSSTPKLFVPLVVVLALASSCSADGPEDSNDAAETLAADFDDPSFFSETTAERAAAFLEVVEAMPLNASAFEDGVGSGIDGRDLTESHATYAVTLGDDDYDQWLAEVWAMNDALIEQGFVGVHHSCNPGLFVNHLFRGLYQNDEQVMLSLEWPQRDAFEGQLEIGYVGDRPERLSDYQISPAPNPEMCLPPISTGG